MDSAGHQRLEVSQGLLRIYRFKEPPHRGNAIRGKSYAFSMFADDGFIRSKVHAVNLVAGHIAVKPADLGTHSFYDTDRLLRDFPQLRIRQVSGSRNFAFNDELWQGIPQKVPGC
jgi:hypothetical protein